MPGRRRLGCRSGRRSVSGASAVSSARYRRSNRAAWRDILVCMSSPSPVGLPTRADALALMHEYTASESLRKHMLAVEAAMRAYAEHFGDDPERWGLAGLIHDFDYERYPNAAHSPTEEHPAWGVRLLRARGWPEDVLDAIMG